MASLLTRFALPLWSSVLCCTVLYCAVLCCTALHCAVMSHFTTRLARQLEDTSLHCCRHLISQWSTVTTSPLTHQTEAVLLIIDALQMWGNSNKEKGIKTIVWTFQNGVDS